MVEEDDVELPDSLDSRFLRLEFFFFDEVFVRFLLPLFLAIAFLCGGARGGRRADARLEK